MTDDFQRTAIWLKWLEEGLRDAGKDIDHFRTTGGSVTYNLHASILYANVTPRQNLSPSNPKHHYDLACQKIYGSLVDGPAETMGMKFVCDDISILQLLYSMNQRSEYFQSLLDAADDAELVSKIKSRIHLLPEASGSSELATLVSQFASTLPVGRIRPRAERFAKLLQAKKIHVTEELFDREFIVRSLSTPDTLANMMRIIGPFRSRDADAEDPRSRVFFNTTASLFVILSKNITDNSKEPFKILGWNKLRIMLRNKVDRYHRSHLGPLYRAIAAREHTNPEKRDEMIKYDLETRAESVANARAGLMRFADAGVTLLPNHLDMAIRQHIADHAKYLRPDDHYLPNLHSGDTFAHVSDRKSLRKVVDEVRSENADTIKFLAKNLSDNIFDPEWLKPVLESDTRVREILESIKLAPKSDH